MFCQNCGRTYDVRLCPRQHQNPRGAQVCSQCGSRELSTPQPKIPMSWRLLALVVRLGLGLLLFYISLSLLIDLIRTPQFQQFLVLAGLMVGGAWWCYSQLPDWLQQLIRAIWRWRSHDD
jgi:DNA-directed RNA polymerase subunit RPC12/RpoP